MKLKPVHYLFLGGILLSGNATCDTNDQKKANLKGKVKAVTETSYYYNNSVKGHVQNKEKISFDDYGNTLLIEKYKEDGTAWIYRACWSFSKGVLDKDDNDSAGHRISHCVCHLDANGNTLKEDFYKLDLNGNKIKDGLTQEGIITWSHNFSYDSNGFKIGEEVYFYGTLNWKDEFENDPQGRQIEGKEYRAGKLDYRWTIKYNDSGDEIEKHSYGGDGVEKESLSSTFSYTYDMQGNWITRTQTYKDGTSILTEREIVLL